MIEPGSVLETDDASYTVLGPAGEGGFGIVLRVVRDGDGAVFAAKVMQEPDVSGRSKKIAAEIWAKTRGLFEKEINILDELGDIELAQRWAQNEGWSARSPQPFPRYYGSGDYDGLPFYVMEWLEPVNLKTLNTDERRKRYLFEVCDAVDKLHGEGYVHYDLKPSNIMRRTLAKGENGYEYVLTDFGSVHAVEDHDHECRRPQNTMSMLSNGARLRARTPSYADPWDDLHTVHADIYALGQVIRDLFEVDVPFMWSPVINKCTSRYYGYRYNTVAELKRDIENLEGFRREVYLQLRKERIAEQHKKEHDIEKAKDQHVTWADIRADRPEESGRGMKVWRVELKRSSPVRFRVAEPLVLPEKTILLIHGKGILVADISGPASSAVVLRSYVTFHNTNAAKPPENELSYVLAGPGAYLNFPNLVRDDYQSFFRGGRRRIHRDIDVATDFRFQGPPTFSGVEKQTIAAIRESQLPKAYKKVLIEFFKGENLSVSPRAGAQAKD